MQTNSNNISKEQIDNIRASLDTLTLELQSKSPEEFFEPALYEFLKDA